MDLTLRSEVSRAEIYNNIFWNNTADTGDDLYLDNYYGATVNAYNNNFDPSKVSGDFTNEGGNIHADPLFLDASSGDYHLLFGSPCIDAGESTAPALPAMDFEGDGRVLWNLGGYGCG